LSSGTPTCKCGTAAACPTGAACVSNIGGAQCGFACCPTTCPP
jgi:hypothetical protein